MKWRRWMSFLLVGKLWWRLILFMAKWMEEIFTLCSQIQKRRTRMVENNYSRVGFFSFEIIHKQHKTRLMKDRSRREWKKGWKNSHQKPSILAWKLESIHCVDAFLLSLFLGWASALSRQSREKKNYENGRKWFLVASFFFLFIILPAPFVRQLEITFLCCYCCCVAERRTMSKW